MSTTSASKSVSQSWQSFSAEDKGALISISDRAISGCAYWVNLPDGKPVVALSLGPVNLSLDVADARRIAAMLTAVIEKYEAAQESEEVAA